MKTAFSRTLSKKKVMSTDGVVIGTIRNIMADYKSGEVTDLVVKPEPGLIRPIINSRMTNCSFRLKR